MARSLLVLAALLGVLAATVAADRHNPPGGRWQYTVQFGAGNGVNPERHQRQLDSLGQQGWELVAVIGAQMGGNTGTAVLYLKRPAP